MKEKTCLTSVNWKNKLSAWQGFEKKLLAQAKI